MKPSEQLKKALHVLDDGKRWIKGHYAKTKSGGLAVVPYCENAYSFCALGAVRGVDAIYHSAEHYLHQAMPAWAVNVIQYNDDPRCEFKHVRALYCKAIRLAQEAGQ